MDPPLKLPSFLSAYDVARSLVAAPGPG